MVSSMDSSGQFAKLIEMVFRYGEFYLVSEPQYTPWPDDPDGGELRLIGTLRRLLEEAQQAQRNGATVISIERIRQIVDDELCAGSPECAS